LEAVKKVAKVAKTCPNDQCYESLEIRQCLLLNDVSGSHVARTLFSTGV